MEEEFEPALSLAMAACWLQAGMADKAQQALTLLRDRHPTVRVVIAGREAPMFSGSADAVDWLVGLVGQPPVARALAAEDWLMFRGDPARNAAVAGGAPLLSMRWRVPTTDDPAVGSSLEQRQQAATERGEPMLPSFHPLAVGDVLLMRTLRNLLAVDFATGKRLWEVPEEEGNEALPNLPDADRQSPREQMIEQRARNDLTYGTLSSDGQYVFSVEDSAATLGPGAMRGRMANGMIRRGLIQPMMPGEPASPCNRLAAYEIRTGKLKWHLGGPAGPYELRQKETFFLGPPLPLMGQLYVLAEIKGEIRLLALESATGNLLWSQQLAITEQSLGQVRSWAGGSPSYADGVLVCPTSTGAVVGVELATRSLLWGYQYAQDPTWSNRGGFAMMGRRRVFAAYSDGTPPPRWIDAGISIVGGRVLATPIESDSLHCLRLRDGELLWKSPRHDDLFVACADQKKVVLVGRHAVRALRLTDGKRAWGGRTLALPEDGLPSGRGFLADQRYFLPMTNAEVIAIDLDAGKIVQTAKSRTGDVPGNLISYRGKVISLGLEGMEAYYQRDAALAEIGRRSAPIPTTPRRFRCAVNSCWMPASARRPSLPSTAPAT